MDKNFLTARTPDEVREQIITDMFAWDGNPVTDGSRGAITGRLNKYLGSDQNRYIVLNWLFGVTTSKKLDDSQWSALYKWIGFFQVEGQWEIDGRFPLECGLVLTRALREQGEKPVDERMDEVDEENLLHQTILFMEGVNTAVTGDDGEILQGSAKFPLKKVNKTDYIERFRPPDIEL